ncbi:hexokinase-1 [Niveomyces insectorum RCEF 264]|uniref:Phosphotransferase n=1 Tax=Niveomyces insectorum RCEF 264 TaxID=1081102 RepID=A0A167LTS4_9HYPO|nr:hexokinase-1 [Niveomyces insectorum RCEF 264]
MSIDEPEQQQQQQQQQGHKPSQRSDDKPTVSKEAFFRDAAAAFTAGVDVDSMHDQACALEASLRANAANAQSLSMLPSFIGRAPAGSEHGKAIAVDIGGSTMRVAVVRLDPAAADPARRLTVERYREWPIALAVKNLDEHAFFDWIAGNIKLFLLGREEIVGASEVDVLEETLPDLPLGLVWSFPLNQTSLDDGELRSMGKAFAVGAYGKSIHACMAAAFARARLPLRLAAILNDSVSVLLAMQYRDPATRLSVVAGTGFNGAVQLPTGALAAAKYGSRRAPAWRRRARHVLVDAELCVTGHGIFPLTAWDRQLIDALPTPFQPGLELLVGGLFVGEILRRVMADAVQQAAFLGGGALPDGLQAPFSLRLETITMLLGDDTAQEDEAIRGQLSTALGLPAPIGNDDLHHLRTTAHAVMHRTAGFLSAATYAMKLLYDEECGDDDVADNNMPPHAQQYCTVSCIGSLIEKCPGFMEQSQANVDRLHDKTMAQHGRTGTPHNRRSQRLRLAVAAGSSLTGVAVAALMARTEAGSEDGDPPSKVADHSRNNLKETMAVDDAPAGKSPTSSTTIAVDAGQETTPVGGVDVPVLPQLQSKQLSTLQRTRRPWWTLALVNHFQRLWRKAKA